MKKLKKVLLIGAGGQLGTALQKLYPNPSLYDFVWIPITRKELELADFSAVSQFLRREKLDYIVNAAAYTNVDGAEDHINECFAINAFLPKILLDYCMESRCHLIHISTDYVFGGNAREMAPYIETNHHAPLNAYGASKSKGEELLLSQDPLHLHILRTSWLYGPRAWGKSFYKSILDKGISGDPLRVVEDEIGSPTSTLSLARTIVSIIYGDINGFGLPSGIYHCADKGSVSRYEFAKAILSLDPIARRTPITSITSAELPPRAALRPKDSTLECNKLEQFDPDLVRPWQEGLKAVYILDKKEHKDEV